MTWHRSGTRVVEYSPAGGELFAQQWQIVDHRVADYSPLAGEAWWQCRLFDDCSLSGNEHRPVGLSRNETHSTTC